MHLFVSFLPLPLSLFSPFFFLTHFPSFLALFYPSPLLPKSISASDLRAWLSPCGSRFTLWFPIREVPFPWRETKVNWTESQTSLDQSQMSESRTGLDQSQLNGKSDWTARNQIVKIQTVLSQTLHHGQSSPIFLVKSLSWISELVIKGNVGLGRKSSPRDIGCKWDLRKSK